MKRSSLIFKENHVFTEEKNNPSDKPVTIEELDGIKLMFINEEFGILKVVIDGG